MENTSFLQYRVLHKLGAGGMGQVYLAEDTTLGRKVALKFLHAQYTSNPDFHARFEREARAAAALHHPNIIVVYEFGEHQNHAYLAMEYIEGGSLKDWLVKQEPTLAEVIDTMLQAGAGLSEAHQAGITHRDLKSTNILIDQKQRVKIADFGLAKLEGLPGLTVDGTVMGTPAYMSPEQVRGKRLDPRSDIFSLGVVFYELITRRLPFAGENDFQIFEAIQHHQPEPLARYNAGVSEGLQRIVDKALDKKLENRYQHIEELLADLTREKRILTTLAPAIALKSKSPSLEAMVRIPAGTFLMGCNDGDHDEKPVHQVGMEAFYMDRHEVTVEKYQRFLQVTKHRVPENWAEQLQFPQRPVVYVSWDDAVAYAEWQGKRLPTEAEWEYAARGGYNGVDGKSHYQYSWGDEASPDQANFDFENNRRYDWENAKQHLKTVGSYAPNGYGLYDMIGNVWEWCADWYGAGYYWKSPPHHPPGPASGSVRVLRGGSWNYLASHVRCANRRWSDPKARTNVIGFRCVFTVGW